MSTHSCVVRWFLILAAVAMHSDVTRAQPVVQNEKVRPYEFGFTIDEQQHRHEKRDERGIVMGEYGFITADGIYHVTVYATDEEGKFRILAMRSYPYESPPKTIEMTVRPKVKPTPKLAATSTTATPFVLPKFNSNKKACSGCFIPKDSTVSPSSSPSPSSSSSQPLPSSSPSFTPTGKSPKVPIRTLSKPLEPEERQPAFVGSSGIVNLPDTTFNTQPDTPDTLELIQNYTPSSTSNNLTPPTLDTNPFEGSETEGQVGAGGDAGNDFINPIQNDVPNTQTFGITETQSAAVPGTTKPNVRQPLPEDDIKQVLRQNIGKGNFGSNGASAIATPGTASDFGDLYRFKYLLDYNGHTETGSRNGNKEGSYFSIGEDNVKRTIEYIANEFGFQPHISWRKLKESEQLPKENSLKDYEFIWYRKD